MTFKFDFSPTIAGGGGGNGGGAGDAGEEGEGVDPLPTPVAALAATSTATAREDGSPPSPPPVVVIARMMDRCAASAGACRIIEASPPPPLPPSPPSSHRRPARDVVVDLSGGGGDDATMGGLRCVVVDDDDGPARPDFRAVVDSDLIPGVYEGGLKVWECSLDLCRHLASVVVVVVGADDRGGEGGGDPAPPSIVGAAVARAIGPGGSTLELGCGHGLPGCLILREGARRVCDEDDVVRGRDGGDVAPPIVVFSDFNDFVLRRATIPNAFLNVARGPGRRRRQPTAGDRPTRAFDDDGEAGREGGMSARWALLRERSIFVAGDWMGISHMLTSGRVVLPPPTAAPSSRKTTDNDDCGDHGRRSGRRRREGEARAASDRFDLILASETTYTTDSCLDTAFLMLRHLRVDVGVGLVATKRFYFGVGGGTDAFVSACEALSSSTARGGGDDADRDGEASRLADLRLCVRVARSYDTGNANIRDLLEVTCRGK